MGRRRFFVKKTIHNTRKGPLFGFSISCTTQTVYTVRYTNGSLCNCGEYFVKDQTKTVTCEAQLIGLNFTVETSVRNISTQSGENCSFSFVFFSDGSFKSDVRLLPGNGLTTLQPSLATTMMEFPEGTVDVCYITFRYKNKTRCYETTTTKSCGTF